MTSTTSKLDWAFIAAKSAILIYAVVLMAVGCAAPDEQPTQHVRARVATMPPVASAPEASAPETPKAEEKKEEKEPPYYGSTYWDELLTSVYYYPTGNGNNVPSTHLKFDHREDDLYLCGDQRKSFEPGTHYKLWVTYEPNQPCVSNWKIK